MTALSSMIDDIPSCCRAISSSRHVREIRNTKRVNAETVEFHSIQGHPIAMIFLLLNLFNIHSY